MFPSFFFLFAAAMGRVRTVEEKRLCQEEGRRGEILSSPRDVWRRKEKKELTLTLPGWIEHSRG